MKSLIAYPRSFSFGEVEILPGPTQFILEETLASAAQRHLDDRGRCILAHRELTVGDAHDHYIDSLCEAVDISIEARQGCLSDAEERDCSAAAWEVGRGEVVTTRGRAQQRRQAQLFEERLREDASARRMLGIAFCIVLAIVGILLYLFLPPLVRWIATHGHHAAPGLLPSCLVPPPVLTFWRH